MSTVSVVGLLSALVLEFNVAVLMVYVPFWKVGEPRIPSLVLAHVYVTAWPFNCCAWLGVCQVHRLPSGSWNWVAVPGPSAPPGVGVAVLVTAWLTPGWSWFWTTK